jgi:hypothetical protein
MKKTNVKLSMVTHSSLEYLNQLPYESWLDIVQEVVKHGK